MYRWPELRDIKADPKVRWAAVIAGWIVVAACLPGLAVIWRTGLSVGWRVCLIALVAGGSVYVALELVFRRLTRGLDMKTRRPHIESFVSREFTFLLNNWILISLLFSILIATTFPLISEALTGEKVTVGPPFYNMWVQPLGLVLLFLMGVGTLFGWKKTGPGALRRAFRAPLIAWASAAVLHLAVGKALGFPAIVFKEAIYSGTLGAVLRGFNAITPVLGTSLCVFNVAVIVQEFGMLFRARAKTGADKGTPGILWWLGGLPGFAYTLLSLSPQSRRRYGGYVVHFGIVLMFIGFTGQSWNTDRETSLLPGQSYQVNDYSFTYARERMEVDNNKRMVFADVDVYKTGKLLGRMEPAKFIYKKSPESPTTEVAILHRLGDDIYVIVGSINPDTKVAAFQIHTNPLVSWIWIGCIVLILGSFVCMWPQLELGESRVWLGARAVGASAASVFLGIMLAATPAARAQTTMPGMDGNSGVVRIDNDVERGIFSSLRCMCGDCQRDLLSTCPCNAPHGAEWARQMIRGKLKAGETRDQIIDEYAAEFGAEALAVPPNTGIFRAIWFIPVLGIGLGAFGVARMVRRWRQGDQAAPGSADKAKAPARDAYDARLDDELKDLDG
jgi:cytochrome c-type biogenesis protein CcmF